jgi:hypothetical protein
MINKEMHQNCLPINTVMDLVWIKNFASTISFTVFKLTQCHLHKRLDNHIYESHYRSITPYMPWSQDFFAKIYSQLTMPYRCIENSVK